MAKKPSGGAPVAARPAGKPEAVESNGHIDRDEFERIKTKLHDRTNQQDAIFRARKNVLDCHKRIKELAADSKEAKEDLKDAEAYLHRLIDAQASGQKTLPMDASGAEAKKADKPKPAPKPKTENNPDGAPTEAETPKEGAGESKPAEKPEAAALPLFTTPEARLLATSCPASHIGRNHAVEIHLPGKKPELHTGICGNCLREAEAAELASKANSKAKSAINGQPDGPLKTCFEGLSTAWLERMAGAGIVKVSDYEKAVGDGSIKKIPGLAEAKLGKIAEAYQAFRDRALQADQARKTIDEAPPKAEQASPTTDDEIEEFDDPADHDIDDLGDEFPDDTDPEFQEIVGDDLGDEPEEFEDEPSGAASDEIDEVLNACYDVFVNVPGEVAEGWDSKTRKRIHGWAVDVSNAAGGHGDAPSEYPREVERFMAKGMHNDPVGYVKKRRGG